MSDRPPTVPILLLLLALAARPLAAAPPATAPGPAAPEPAAAPGAAEADEGDDAPSVTRHTTIIDGEPIAYTATAGTIPLMEEDGTVKARVFFVAYEQEGVEDAARRPVTFTFNGGPGSSSVWLHLGAFGPKRVHMTDEGEPIGPPYALVDNESSLLDLTDLVFIDPVMTGYSRPAPGEDKSQFHGIDEDVESVGEFIRLWTTRYERWSSPKFLAGESYGTTRAAGLAGHLQERHGMFLNGLVLVSAILNFQTARFDRGNDLSFLLVLPTCTATAWYHERLEPGLQADLAAALREVETFVRGDYALALMQGDRLPEAERRAVAARIARYTGLTPEYVERSNLRVHMGRFVKELLRDQRRTVGRLDSRYKGVDADAAGERYEYDPSYAAIQGPYTAMLNHHVRVDLGYESDLSYEILTGRVRPWSYRGYENRYVNVAETLRTAMTRNHALRVFVASGYYDFATPYFATDYTVDHLGLDPALAGHVTVRRYEAGHMMYVHRPSREQLKRDLEAFYGAALPGGSP
ncbi:MAG: S10 family peptidase [Planctomycetota bacterium]